MFQCCVDIDVVEIKLCHQPVLVPFVHPCDDDIILTGRAYPWARRALEPNPTASTLTRITKQPVPHATMDFLRSKQSGAAADFTGNLAVASDVFNIDEVQPLPLPYPTS